MEPSELFGDALRIHLAELAAEDSAAWESTLLAPKEEPLGSIGVWEPAEDWSDWVDPQR